MPIINASSPFIRKGLRKGNGFVDRLWKNMGTSLKSFFSGTLAPLAGSLLQGAAVKGANHFGLPSEATEIIKGLVNPEMTKGLAGGVNDQLDSVFDKRAKDKAKSKELYDADEEVDVPQGKDVKSTKGATKSTAKASTKSKSGPPPPSDAPPELPETPTNPTELQKQLLAVRKKHLGYGEKLSPKKEELLSRLVRESPLIGGKGLRILKQ